MNADGSGETRLTDYAGYDGEPDWQPLPAAPGYVFHGFFGVVDNAPTVNVVKAGKGIAVKFDLDGDQGLDVLAAGSPSSTRVACSAEAPRDAIEETVNATHNSLAYDPTVNPPIGQYVYLWKTDKAWAGTCQRLDLTLDDGTTHSASFSFTK
jgi:hypothetical protein